MSTKDSIDSDCAAILEALASDIVGIDELVQILKDLNPLDEINLSKIKNTLSVLLAAGVEIGIAKITSANYVEFVAWRGDEKAKLLRAVELIPHANFGFWLALSVNVDRQEI
jgi:hypothetical protein